MAPKTVSRDRPNKSSSARSGENRTDEKPDFFDRLRIVTEKYLGYRKRKKRLRKEKQKKKNVILDWVEAFLWAAGMVLLINQYLMQAYQIPS